MKGKRRPGQRGIRITPESVNYISWFKIKYFPLTYFDSKLVGYPKKKLIGKQKCAIFVIAEVVRK